MGHSRMISQAWIASNVLNRENSPMQDPIGRTLFSELDMGTFETGNYTHVGLPMTDDTWYTQQLQDLDWLNMVNK